MYCFTMAADSCLQLFLHSFRHFLCWPFTDKIENQIFLIYKEIQGGAVAKSYMRKGFLIYEEMHKYFLICEEAVKSYMTLQLLHSEFYILFYQCSVYSFPFYSRLVSQQIDYTSLLAKSQSHPFVNNYLRALFRMRGAQSH